MLMETTCECVPALPCWRVCARGFGKFRDVAQLAPLHDLCQVNQDHQLAAQFADAGDIVQLALLEDVRRRFDQLGVHLEHLVGGIDHQPDLVAIDFGDHDAVAAVLLRISGKTFSQVHHGNDLAAQVDDAFDEDRCIGDDGNVHHAHDLVHDPNGHAEVFLSDAEADDLLKLCHPILQHSSDGSPPGRTSTIR